MPIHPSERLAPPEGRRSGAAQRVLGTVHACHRNERSSLVSRTVTYALVTALLVIPYLLVVPTATKLAEGSGSLAVATATLTVAALFQPLRRRVQDLVDRRFNRRRSDAARTVDAFAARLRDQVDLDALEAGLLGVADRTMQPTRASLWLRARPAGAANLYQPRT